MKKIKYLLAIFAVSLMLFSCGNDDEGGGGNPPPTPILANVFATSNTSNTIVAYDFTPSGVGIRPLRNSSSDNEGIFYDVASDILTVLSREQKVINTFQNVDETPANGDLNLLASSGVLLDSPRDLVVKDNFYIVSDNADVDGDPNTEEGRFFVFTKDTMAFTLRNIVSVDYAVWGIELIGNDLYTVVDKTSDVAVLKNFISTYTTDVTAVPDKQITIEGITRTHGIAHDNGFVILTDIGDAANDGDGGFHFINGFVSKFDATPAGGTLSFAGNQVRVSGSFTDLGNPVAVAYESTSQTVFVAERAKDGGKILFFSEIGAGGNIAPSFNSPFEGASSLYFVDR